MKIVCFGDFLMHFSPLSNDRFIQTDIVRMSFTGAEANVGCALSLWGEAVEFVTALPDNALADKGVRFLKSLDIDTSHIVKKNDGRMGIYFLENGFSVRSSSVIYDRLPSTFSTSSFNDYDWKNVLHNADAFCLSGITPCLSENVFQCCKKVLKLCKEKGIKVYFDLNYRPKLSSIEKASQILLELSPFIDTLIANEEHLKLLLNIASPLKEEQTKERLIDIAEKTFDKLGKKQLAITVRRTHSATETSVYACLFEKGVCSLSTVRRLQVLDRVGSGDAFTAGLIYADLNNYNTDKKIEFAVASNAYKHAVANDVNFSSVQEINSLIDCSFLDVKR